MKKFRTLLALILVLSAVASVLSLTSAEADFGENLQADLQKLMSDANIPKSTIISYDLALPEDAQTHSHAIEKVNGDGVTLRIDLTMAAAQNAVSDEDWTALDAWLSDVSSQAIQGIAVDTESIANVVAQAIASNRQSTSGESADVSVWNRSDWHLTEVRVTIPYYPELSSGVNGTATQKLQQRLIELGFLNDRADGYFGGNTQNAVEMLERYVRTLEQDWLDAQPTIVPTPTPSPQPESTMEVAVDVMIESEATAQPVPTPITPVDGVADALLQAYLYSDDFVTVRSELQSGAQGDDVVRIQNRLLQLGCMIGSADGVYGGDTERGIRIFQYANNLEQTGVADEDTQNLLFSSAAKAPENPMLSVGSSGDAVKTLQLRLRVLGFMNGSVDGDYGAATVTGVKNLQTYMRSMEEKQIRADESAMAQLEQSGAEVSTLLTVEVNGVADPILLDDFYSDSFPAIPSAMQSGSSGDDVVRLQRRLNTLEYYYGSLDGQYGSGTQKAVQDFQKRNGLEQTGVGDTATLSLLFSQDAQKALKPYVLKISTDDQRVYAYGLDNNNEYTVLVRTMKCSTGKDATPTPKGTYQNGTGPGARWHYFKKYDCWAQYAYYIDGDIMFHSVLYNEKEGKVTQSSVNNLGRKASHGCVRLSVEDAKWIYTNCPTNTKIIVY